MEVKVYDWEMFDRGKRWYVVFVSVFVFIILLSLLTKNLVGAILLFFFLWGYIIYSLTSSKIINLMISDEGLKIWGKIYPRSNIEGFVLEIDEKKQTLKNIVFLIWNNKLIHTFADEGWNIKTFVQNLYDYLPLVGDYQQWFLDRISRVLKL